MKEKRFLSLKDAEQFIDKEIKKNSHKRQFEFQGPELEFRNKSMYRYTVYYQIKQN